MDESKQRRTKAAERALQRAIWDSNEILISAATVLKRRRQSLTLNRTKLILEEHSSFGGGSVQSFQIEDVYNIDGAIGPVFGTVKIATKFTKPGEPLVVGLFRRKDVLLLKRIVQGYIIALQKQLDLAAIPTEELRDMLYDLGEDDIRIQ